MKDTYVPPRGGVPDVVAGLWSDQRTRTRSHAEPAALFYQLDRQQAWMAGERLTLAPRQARVLVLILVCHPRLARYDEIIEALWGDTVDGGATDAMEAIWNCASAARRASIPRGFDLVNVHGRGFHVEPLTVAKPSTPAVAA